MATSFQDLPIIDFSRLEKSETKAQALSELRGAIFDVGFLYLVNTGLEPLIKEAHKVTREIFELPALEKAKCQMRNSPSFLGYTDLETETTAERMDIREQFDFGTTITKAENSDGLVWRKLEGMGQHPNAKFKDFVKRYTTALSALSTAFLRHVADCLSLPSETFDQFIGNMSRMKMAKYPPAKPGSQGVGPHKDSLSLFTFLSQDHIGGLQVLNKAGQWIDAPPIEGSFVVNIAQGFEAVTGGLCSATTHRVQFPTTVTRHSIPFFQAVKLDITFDDLKRSAAAIRDRIPYCDNRKKEEVDVPSDLISPLFSTIGEAQLGNRILSHPDVGEKWYPDLYEKYVVKNSG